MNTTFETPTNPIERSADVVAHTLISSANVTDTDVFSESGDRLGKIDSIIINKISGQVAYAVMSFGGFLGIGEKYHPLPWNVLDYDVGLGGYRVDLDRDDLIDAPSYDREAISSYDFDADTGGIGAHYVGKSRLPRDVPVASQYDSARETI